MPLKRRKTEKNIRNQVQSILRETGNPAIISDVVDTEFGVIPGTFEDDKKRRKNGVEESIVRNSVDGKTWNTVEKE